MSAPGTYKKQYDRMISWYERLDEIQAGEGNQMAYLIKTDVFTFFQNAYLLKDWIKNDKDLKIESKDVDDFINQHECMKWCADVYNEVKPIKVHSERNGSKPMAKKMKSRQRVDLVSGKGIRHIKVEVGDNNDVTKDAFDLAAEVKEKWEEFIEKNF